MARQRLSPKDVVTDVAPVPSGRQRLTANDNVTDMPGVGETVARHGLQGLTFKFSDELAGVGTAIGDKLASLFTDAPGRKSAAEAFREGRDEERANLQRTAAANPDAALASELVGGVLLPIPGAAAAKGATLGARALRAAGVGAGAGALTGAGGAKEMADIPLDAAIGAGVGGALGGAIPVAGALGSKAIGAGRQLAKRAAPLAAKVGKDRVVQAAAGAAAGAVGGGVPGAVVGAVAPKVIEGAGRALRRLLTKRGAGVSDDAAREASGLKAPSTSGDKSKPDWVMSNSEALPPPPNTGFARPYDAAERARFRAKPPTTAGGLDEATEKWAAQAAEAERARRAGPSTAELLRRRINGEPPPEIASSAAARELTTSQPPSVNIRPPAKAPEPVIDDPLNVRPLLESARRDAAAHAPTQAPELPVPQVADDVRPPGTDALRLGGTKTMAERWKKQAGRPKVVPDDAPIREPRGYTPAQDRALERLRGGGIVKPETAKERAALAQLTKHKGSGVVYDAKAGGYRLGAAPSPPPTTGPYRGIKFNKAGDDIDRLASPEELMDATVNGRLLAESLESGLSSKGLERVREGVKSGKLKLDKTHDFEPVRVVVSPRGKLEVEGGRHRILVARELGKPLRVRFQKGGAGMDTP